jgi:hypothetical protein
MVKMKLYMGFTEYLERRDAARIADLQSSSPGARETDPGTGSPTHHNLPDPEAAVDEGQVEARALFGALFKSPFKAVNPSRPVLPTNSLLLASPFRRKRRLKSQIIGR